MNVIVIDPFNREIYETDLPEKYDLDALYKIMDCSIFTTARISREDCLYVDDEGLLKDPKKQAFFAHDDYPSVLAGKAIVIGTDSSGESIPPKTTIGEVRRKVTWMIYRG